MAWNLTSSTFLAEPQPLLAQMRAAGPLVETRVPLIGRTWVTTTDAAARALLKDPRFVRDPKGATGRTLAGPWVPGRNSSGDLCLIGFRPCGRGGKRTKAFSAKLRAIDVDRGWALTVHGWYRLGQRISGPEFQALRPRYSNLQEFSDQEIEASLLADRARLALKIRQIKPPLPRRRASGAPDPEE